MSAAGPAARAIKKADDGIGAWLGDLVTGAGSSPSHIIVTAVLGVVPGVGQAMDARDLILGIIAVSKSPASVMVWTDLVISLIGCVPAVGDALKAGFKLMKQGHNFGRVLERVSPNLRGDVQRFMRNVDWTMLTRSSKSLFDKTILAFIDAIDSWMVKLVAGRAQVADMIAELKGIQQRGPQMIDGAIAELRRMHARMIGDELPKNTAAARPRTSRPAPAARHNPPARTATPARTSTPTPAARVSTRPPVQERHPRVQTNTSTTSTKKAAERKKQPWRSGIPAEHITDYFVRRKHVNFRKANNGGRLIEEWSLGHNGLDHLWRNATSGRPFVVGETKSSIFDSFRLIGALPADLRESFNVLRESEAATPAPNGKPNIFDSAGRDAHADRRVPVGGDSDNEAELRKGLNKPNPETGLPTQMSHRWIRQTLPSESLTAAGRELPGMIRDWEDGDRACPYQRWISLVTGRQLHKHKQSKGQVHQVQTVLNIPDNVLRA